MNTLPSFCYLVVLQFVYLCLGFSINVDSVEEEHSGRHKRHGHDFDYDSHSKYVFLSGSLGVWEWLLMGHFPSDPMIGPPNWAITWRECDGIEQSPVDLNEDDADLFLYRVRFKGMKMKHHGVFLNNGHAPTFQLSGNGSTMTGLPCFRHEKFMLQQFHFHFRHGPHDGTEHSINGTKYAAELHMVHYNIKYGSFTKAVDKYDGLAVLAVLMEAKDVHDDGRDVFDHFIKTFGTKILDPSNHRTHCTFNPFDITPTYHDFFYYKGSLTTPGCFQSVHWVVFRKRIYIKPKTLEIFRRMHTKHHGERISKLGNIRPTQPLYGRHVLINFFPDKTSKTLSENPCEDLMAKNEFEHDVPSLSAVEKEELE